MFMMFHASRARRPWLIALFGILLLIGGLLLILEA